MTRDLNSLSRCISPALETKLRSRRNNIQERDALVHDLQTLRRLDCKPARLTSDIRSVIPRNSKTNSRNVAISITSQFSVGSDDTPASNVCRVSNSFLKCSGALLGAGDMPASSKSFMVDEEKYRARELKPGWTRMRTTQSPASGGNVRLSSNLRVVLAASGWLESRWRRCASRSRQSEPFECAVAILARTLEPSLRL